MGRPSLIVAVLVGILQSAAPVAGIDLNPNSVSVDTRMSWCDQQMSSCGLLCGADGADNNSCDHNTLKYACQCSNGTAPGLAYYTGTMPTFICLQASEACQDPANTIAVPKDECTPDMKSQCGTLDPANAQKASSTAGSPSAAASSTPTEASTQTSAAATSSAATPSDTSDTDGMGTNAIIGIAVAAAVVGLLSLLGLGCVLHRRRRQQRATGGSAAGGGAFEKLKDEGSRVSVHELQTHEQCVELNARRSIVEMPGSTVMIAELDGSPMPVSPMMEPSVPSSPFPVSPLPAASSLASPKLGGDEWDHRRRRDD